MWFYWWCWGYGYDFIISIISILCLRFYFLLFFGRCKICSNRIEKHFKYYYRSHFHLWGVLCHLSKEIHEIPSFCLSITSIRIQETKQWTLSDTILIKHQQIGMARCLHLRINFFVLLFRWGVKRIRLI